jgi:protein arginine N-methyltransferase 1
MGESSKGYNEAAARLYAHTAQVLSVHELLLSDEHRNKKFYEALAAVVTNQKIVLDIGTGSGIWAITAAALGAKKVVAIDRDEIVSGLVKRLAADNGVGDRIEFICGDPRQLQLPRQFDVVISETIGNVIFEEDIVPLMADARERFLTPGGVLIPSGVTLMVAPAFFPRPSRLPSGISGNFDYFSTFMLNSPVALTDKSELQLVGEARKLVEVDLTSIATALDLTKLHAEWEEGDASSFNCFAVWGEVRLSESLSVSTLETSSWSIMLYRINPFAAPRGKIEFKLSLTSSTNYWAVSLAHDQHQETQSYSPAKAATELVVQTRTNPEVLAQLQRMGLLQHNPEPS